MGDRGTANNISAAGCSSARCTILSDPCGAVYLKPQVMAQSFGQGLAQAARRYRDVVAVTLGADVQQHILQVGDSGHAGYTKKLAGIGSVVKRPSPIYILIRPSSVIRLLKVKSIGLIRPWLQP